MSEAYDCEHEEELAKLFGEAATLLSGASSPELVIRFYDTLKDFFSNTNCWREWIQFTVVPNMQDYKIAPAHGGRIIRLLGAIDQNRVPQNAVMGEIGTVTFLYPYTTVQPMWANVVKTVTRAFKDGKPFPPYIPDWVLPSYSTGLLDGLVGRMMVEPGQSYSNVAAGTYHLARYGVTVSLARTEAMRANTVGAQAWAYPQSFRTFGQRGGVSTFNINPSPQTAR